MWIYTKIGFFSITEKDDRNAPSLRPKKRGLRFRRRVRNRDIVLQVRARFKKDIIRFIDELEPVLGTRLNYSEMPARDYLFRVYAPRWAVQEVIAHLVTDLDYHNFKDTVHDLDKDKIRNTAYEGCWSEMWEAQDRANPKARRWYQRYRDVQPQPVPTDELHEIPSELHEIPSELHEIPSELHEIPSEVQDFTEHWDAVTTELAMSTDDEEVNQLVLEMIQREQRKAY